MQGLLVWSPVRELRSHTPQNNSAHEPQLLSPLTTTRIGMSQQKIPWNTTKILHPATKTWCNQVNKYFKKRYHVFPKKSGKPLIDSGVLVKYWVCGWKCVQFEWRFIAQFSSVTQWCLTLWSHKLQHARPPYPSPTPGAFSNSCPSSWWCHPTISSSVIIFSSHLQSFPASESFPMSQFFTSGGQSIEVSASASVLPMNIQDWFSSGWTGWISLQSKGLSRVFSSTTVQKHQFFGAQFSL